MLTIFIEGGEKFNRDTNEFIYINGTTISLEHSLVSLSKWESKWCKPFLVSDNKTFDEIKDYVKCMTISQNVNPQVYDFLTEKNYEEIKDYINSPMTATWFNEGVNKRHSVTNETVTSELIYYWMVALNIPFECQKWHLNRLLTLIKVCNIKNTPPKKMSKGEILNQNRALNAARRKPKKYKR